MARGHMFYIGLYKYNIKNLSETTRHRALIVGMYHHLVIYIKVCSIYGTVAKIGPIASQEGFVPVYY